MPLYEIEQHELCTVTYRVDAADAAEAVRKLDESQETLRDVALRTGRVEFHGVDVERGLAVDEQPELARQLCERGIARIDDVFPGIARICGVALKLHVFLESELHGRETFDHDEDLDEMLAAVRRLVETSQDNFAVDGIERTVGIAIGPASDSHD